MESQAHCPFCDSALSRFNYSLSDVKGHRWKLMTCRDCSTRFLSPRPSAQILDQAYDESYFGSGDSKFSGVYERSLNFFRKQRAKRIARLIRYSGSVLDIGCGNGSFLEHLSRMGDIEIHGSEVGKGAIDRARKIKGLHLIEGDICRMSEMPGVFDAITAYHVFEHVSDPRAFFDNVAKMSKPGTIVDVSFPNIMSWQACFFRSQWLHLDPPRHLHHMPPRKFIKQMQIRGFKMLFISTLSFEQNPFGLAQSVLNVLFKPRDILLERLKGNRDYAPGHGAFSLFIQKAMFFLLFPLGMLTDLNLRPFLSGATMRLTFRKSGQ